MLNVTAFDEENCAGGVTGHPEVLGHASQGALLAAYTTTTLLSVVGNIFVILVFTIGRRSKTDLTGTQTLFNKSCKKYVSSSQSINGHHSHRSLQFNELFHT